MNQVGDRIKLLRTNKRLTQAQLAALISVDNSMITKIEKGHSTGSLQTLQKLAAALGVTLAELIEGQDQQAACLPNTG